MSLRFKQYLLEAKFKMVDFSQKNDEPEDTPTKKTPKFKMVDYSKMNNDQEEEEVSKKDHEKEDDALEDDSNDEKDESGSSQDDAEDDNQNDEEDSADEEDDEDKDPNMAGVIRTVKYAHLIYKRQDGDSTFTELWAYNINKGLKDEFNIRSAILDGTDIDDKTGTSEDGKQKYTLWTSNGRQFMQITGLQN